MTYRVFWLVAVWSLVFAIPFWTNLSPGGRVLLRPAEGAPTSETRMEFMEGWNEWGTPLADLAYSAPCFGFAYQPSFDYWLERVEFMAGGVAGEATIEIRADVGSGHPTGPVLASGSCFQVATHDWQGADLDGSVYLEPAVTYYIKYWVVVGGYLSASEFGDLIPHDWSYDCTDWTGPATTHFWMARFYGSFEPSAARAATWSGVKALYR